MEHGEGEGEGEGEKRHLEAGFLPSEVKKQWKNPSQVQILENAYAVAPNPSASMKEELAKLTGLDYKQVQYWFGNRRYMDRHGPRRNKSRNEGEGRFVNLAVVSSLGLSYCSTSIADPMAGTESSTSRNSEMLQPLLPTGTGPVMMQAEIATQMPEELQRVVAHIEKKLGHALRADGPILGVEFKPLPPGAFGTPLAQQRAPLWPCDGKVTERPTVELIKEATSLPLSECCSVTNLPNEGNLVVRDVDALDPDGSPRSVQEYQFFPMQPSWLDGDESVKHACCPSASVNTSNYEILPTFSRGQNSSKYAHAASALPSQGPLSNATVNQSEQDKKMTTSALNGNQKAPNLVYTSPASNSQYGNYPANGMSKQFLSCDRTITGNANVHRREKLHPSVSPSGNDNQQLAYIEVQKMIDTKNEKDSGVPFVGHVDLGQGERGQGGQDATHSQRGSRENQSSTVVAFKEVDNKNCNKPLTNQMRNGRPHPVGHRHGYSCYIVRPRDRSQSSTIIPEDARMNYFSDIGNCVRPLIAEWNERENRAVFIDNDNESALSWSTGSDSTCSDGFDDPPTENGEHFVQTQSVDQDGIYIKEDNIRKDHNGQEVMDVDQNIEDDEDETDDEDYNNMKKESRDKIVEINEERRASPLSSEQTA